MPSYTQYQQGWRKLVVIRNTVGPNTFEGSVVIVLPIEIWEWERRRYAKANAHKVIEVKRRMARQIAREVTYKY